jgi:hypothetical protein
MQSNITTLEEIAQLLANWRAQKKHRGEKMPAILRSQLVQILAKYPKATIAKTLNLSNSTIYTLTRVKAKNIQKQKVENSMPDIDFIPVKLNTQSHNLQHNESVTATTQPRITCKIKHPNGAKLIINNGDLNDIIRAFLCYK